MTKKFEKYIYETPDGWGETMIADETTMSNTIETMVNELGDDWENCELSDCDRFSLIKPITDDIALYERMNVRESEYRLYKNIGDGFYEFVYFHGMFGRRVGQIFAETDASAISESREFVADMMEKI